MKTAIVHDWIIDIGGGEKCLENIYGLYPSSDVFTLVFREESAVSLGIDRERVKTSFIHRLPWAEKKYRNYLPFYPLAVEQFDLSGYDVILSSSHVAAKGALTNASQLHICYCFTPARYAWDLYHQYINEAGLNKGLKGKIAKLILHYIRMWDFAASGRVDHFIAISEYIARRIKKIYGRDSAVIYPPVDTEFFKPSGGEREDYYLTASRMVPYKRIDLIVKAFSKMPGKRLVVIGDGPDSEKIKSAAGRNVEILGHQPSDTLREYMQKARAFVFAAEEDFGIIPIEAQACGAPVIAYGAGGSLETIINNKTGVFFREQSVEGLTAAVGEFERNMGSFDYNEIRKNAERFSTERFRREFKMFVESRIDEFNAKTGAGGRL